ncbi:hotdog fold thioesterase [Alkalisalibacterium limincola]|uniref:Hotdog fold thioesterase n=1 Tax=Alkalisalibacterium limincola TaxID=2699169 RepID=A0A5C8KMB8_9GAMM|nr:hotdog fold thioesterase [Alkalisalibacterium limincola]TXK60755.1 hotdog fold thioesterase [Alkalisalibacterium limincola]
MAASPSPFRPGASLERINADRAGTLIERLGIEITGIGHDSLSGTMPVDERTRQPYGLLHGGASVALAETLGSVAANLCLDPRTHIAVGLEINANHVRAVTSGEVSGTASAIHIGRSTQVWDIRITDDQDRLVCVSRLTIAVVERNRTGS